MTKRVGCTGHTDMMITLVGRDGVEVPVRRDAAVSMSGLVSSMMAFDGDDENDDADGVGLPVPAVDGRTLGYVAQYMEHHHNNRARPIPKPLPSDDDIAGTMSDWDRAFLFTDLIKGGDAMQHDLLVDVTLAANYLDVRDLADLTLAAAATTLRHVDLPQDFVTLFFRDGGRPEGREPK